MRISDWSSDVCSSDLSTMRFLDVFLLHCLLADSPPDTREEIAELAHNQHLTAARGREPGLKLLRGDRTSVVSGKRGEVRVDLGGRRTIKKKNAHLTVDSKNATEKPRTDQKRKK